MCGQQAAKRRRSQAKGGWKNLAPQVRPHYKKRSVAASQRKLEAWIEKENVMRMRGKGKGGKG